MTRNTNLLRGCMSPQTPYTHHRMLYLFGSFSNENHSSFKHEHERSFQQLFSQSFVLCFRCVWRCAPVAFSSYLSELKMAKQFVQSWFYKECLWSQSSHRSTLPYRSTTYWTTRFIAEILTAASRTHKYLKLYFLQKELIPDEPSPAHSHWPVYLAVSFTSFTHRRNHFTVCAVDERQIAIV